MSRASVVVLAVAGSLVLGSCTPTPEQDEQGAAAEVATAGVVATDGPALVEGMRDGTWPVADVGEVEFDLTGRGLELVGMRPAAGWEVVDEEVGPDEIEIDLRDGDVRTTVEVGYQSGILEIEVDQLLDPPPDGLLRLGDAGTVELVVEGDQVRVGAVSVEPPWREVQRSEHAGDAELGLRRSRSGAVETWEVDAWVDDGGLEVATDHEIQGLASP